MECYTTLRNKQATGHLDPYGPSADFFHFNTMAATYTKPRNVGVRNHLLPETDVGISWGIPQRASPISRLGSKVYEFHTSD